MSRPKKRNPLKSRTTQNVVGASVIATIAATTLCNLLGITPSADVISAGAMLLTAVGTGGISWLLAKIRK